MICGTEPTTANPVRPGRTGGAHTRFIGQLHIAGSCERKTHHDYAMSPDLIGWAASAILLLTLCRQIYTQSRDDSAKGVSHWLFAGQIAASAGFIVYSWMLHNWVFIITNSAILVTAIVGQVVMLRKRD